MSRIRVAVLRGGPSAAYDESLKTGGYLLSLLRESSEYEPLDVFISKEGEWHHAGVADDPQRILSRADAVWNTLHGDREAARLLEGLRMPFVGSAPAFAREKDLAKELYRRHGLATPEAAVISDRVSLEDELVRIFRLRPQPFVVKPSAGVSGAGVRLARTFHELREAVMKTLERWPKALVEEYVPGSVVTVGVIEQAKGEAYYALVPVHLETDYRRVRPRPQENRRMEEEAKLAHEALGLRHYSASDFIVTPRGKIYILETNSQPVFHEDALFHRALEGSGWQPQEFADHCIKLALGTL